MIKNETDVLLLYDDNLKPTGFIRKSAVDAVVVNTFSIRENTNASIIYANGAEIPVAIDAETIAGAIFGDDVLDTFKKHLQSKQEMIG